MSHEEYIRDQNKRIIFALESLVEYARVADTRGRVIAEMWENQEKLKQERPTALQIQASIAKYPNHPYDWWRLENGTYAKIYRAILEGVVYQEDGKELQGATWNPLSLVSLDRLDGKWNLKNRKTGDNPSGWPEWCK